ncbi:MAG: hypothetical protein ACLPVW_02830, partial [Terriglobales bacterium]
INSYNDHVRLLSPEPVGWLSTTNFTREWEPTLSWNQLRSLTPLSRSPDRAQQANSGYLLTGASLRQPHPAQQVGVARVGADGVPVRSNRVA